MLKNQEYFKMNTGKNFVDTEFKGIEFMLPRKTLRKLTYQAYENRYKRGESKMKLASCRKMQPFMFNQMRGNFYKFKLGYCYDGMVFNIQEDKLNIPGYFYTKIAYSPVAALAIIGSAGREKLKIPFTEVTNLLRQETLKEYGEAYIPFLVSFIKREYKQKLAKNPKDKEWILVKFQEECLNAGIMLDTKFSSHYSDVIYDKYKARFIMQPEIEAVYKKRQEKKALENDKIMKDDEMKDAAKTSEINLNEEAE